MAGAQSPAGEIDHDLQVLLPSYPSPSPKPSTPPSPRSSPVGQIGGDFQDRDLPLSSRSLPNGCLEPSLLGNQRLWSGDDNDDDDYDYNDYDYNDYDYNDYDYNDVDYDLPAATPNGASSKTRQCSGFSPSSSAATWSRSV